jgi:hypothetical protein
MADISLKPNDPLLRHSLETFADTLRDEGYEVELARPREERAGVPSVAVATLEIILGTMFAVEIYPRIKTLLMDWFTEQPRRKRRRLEVHILDDERLIEKYTLEDED